MSDYPIWWDTTLTVYNKFEDPQTQVISWYRTVIDNCFWKYTGDKINIGETVLETNNIICRIPENDLFVGPNGFLFSSSLIPQYPMFLQLSSGIWGPDCPVSGIRCPATTLSCDF